MLRYKHFRGSGDQLEQAINSWLEEFEPDINQMVQTAVEDGSVVIGFLFEESFRGQERRIDREHGMHAEPIMSVDEIPGVPLHVGEEPGYIESEVRGS